MSQYVTYSFAGDSSGAESYMFGQPTYPSVFRASEERPHFNILYRWWEDEATAALWTFDVDVVKRVIRYGLFCDEQVARMALHTRPPPTVDDFLAGLLRPEELPLYANCSHTQKVDTMFYRSKPTAPPLILWSWLPARLDCDSDCLGIAKAIDSESHLHFNRITFDELIRFSLGYSARRVEWFLQQHTCFYAHLLDHFHAFPEQIGKYAEVEQHLRTRSPFAHRAMARALQDSGLAIDLPSLTPGFGFFAGPIQRLFKELQPNLALILKVLGVLGVRFERFYSHAPEMNWSKSFSITFSFLEDIAGSDSPMDLAHSLFNSDKRDFAALTEEGYFNHSVANRLSDRWYSLSTEVWECCKALPETIGYVQESLQPLMACRNYHSLTAILSGLHKYSVSAASLRTDSGMTILSLIELVPLEMLFLLDPSQNYTPYRDHYQRAPGIPFIVPHLYEYQEHGETVLQYFHEQLSAVLQPI
ncbi:uncharacterized protein DSM5745_02852 [Aspergillus mulundensis]|uniref:Ras-GEF domain-containing protein n=1 Tax=Aspergillus mulundensis TaxID=1810919 RepID=A0A3D8SIQ6_9EURO|nr:Uncharacterized protein DSM5745_02852 [Aspergillus mulundensis]RDW86210.1 Uncharacterized protein DSM5745_02852 [Aspergillus mulundensis]